MTKNSEVFINVAEFQELVLDYIGSEEFNKMIDCSVFIGNPDCKNAIIHGMTIASMLAYRCNKFTIDNEIKESNNYFNIKNNILISIASEGRDAETIVIPDGVTEIGSYALAYCGLTEITIPNSVTSIAACAFYGCTSLTSVTIPNSVTEISGSAFSHCSSLKSVTISNSVTEIGWCVFEDCTSLNSVTIPDNVTNICYCAFRGCSNLKSITIPNSVKKINASVFIDCDSLTKIFYTGTEEEWNAITIANNGNKYLINATKVFNYKNK